MHGKPGERKSSADTPNGVTYLVWRLKKWSDFIDVIQGWPSVRNWCFRGQGNMRWELKSSLSRHIEVSKVAPKAWVEQEKRIRRIFERKSHLYMVDSPQADELEWLALMQHHGAPTRLLDFTWSPYVAAFFALERATEDAAVWALNLPLLWDIYSGGRFNGVDISAADPRDAKKFREYYLPNKHAFVWQGDPFRMPQRVIAQSGTFLVTSHLGMSVEQILAGFPDSDKLLVKFVLPATEVRAQAMASLYSMNITQATLFPGLDGLARSMAYEFEYSWSIDPTTNKELEAIRRPHNGMPPVDSFHSRKG
jgi:FRG domain